MFKKMQIQLTIFFTLMLVLLLMGTNLTLYFVLDSYNNAQIVSETNRMLDSISAYEWVQGDDPEKTDSVIEGVEEDDDSEQEEWMPDEEDDNDEVDEWNEINELDDDENNELDDDENNELDDDENNSLENALIQLSNSGNITNNKLQALSYSNDDGSEVKDEGNEIHLADAGELMIPSALDSFSFYFIYDTNGELLKWKSDFDDINRILFEESKKVILGAKPEILNLDGNTAQSFLIQKLPIVINDQMLGYYTVGRDISIANQTLENLLFILIVSLIIGLFISVGLGYLIAGKVMRPIKEAYLSKQVFLADASHELRTPISVVLLSCDALEGEALVKDPFSKQIIKGIRDEVFVMKDLVERLLSLARYDSGSIKYDKKIIDLTEVIQENIKSYRYLSQENNIEIFEQVENGLMVLGDKGLLHSLVSILIDNAIKYNEKNGQIIVTGETVYLKKKTFIQLKVKDTGKGIKKEDIANVFDRFYRADKSRTKRVSGHGLGLSIAKEVVLLHHGNIDVTSEEGVGTTFTVNLPILKK